MFSWFKEFIYSEFFDPLFPFLYSRVPDSCFTLGVDLPPYSWLQEWRREREPVSSVRTAAWGIWGEPVVRHYLMCRYLSARDFFLFACLCLCVCLFLRVYAQNRMHKITFFPHRANHWRLSSWRSTGSVGLRVDQPTKRQQLRFSNNIEGRSSLVTTGISGEC